MRTIITALIASILLTGCGGDETLPQQNLKPYDFGYSAYSKLLARHVIDGLVDYQGLKRDHAVLDSIVADLATADLSRTDVDQRLAFYINAYNILTLKSVVDAYPVNSIKDIPGVWDEKTWPVAGKMVTLNEIEQDILKAEFFDPRVLIAITHASLSCPALSSEPYLPATIDQQLKSAAQQFAVSSGHNRLDPASGTAQLSSLFKEYGDDFIERYYDSGRFTSVCQAESSSLNFLILHSRPADRVKLYDSEYQVSFLPYDWSLNDVK